MKRELLRQIIHVSGVFIIVLGYLIPITSLLLLCIALLIFLLVIFRWDRYTYIPFFSKILRKCKRSDDEKGSIYFFIGIILTILFFHSNMAIVNASILLLIFGDSASTLVGNRWGNIKLPFQSQKTLEGSLTFFLLGLPLVITQLPILPSFFGVLTGTITEAYSPIDDNITVPLFSGLVMTILMNMGIF